MAIRASEVEALCRRLADWARTRPDARALALVGSWARGAAHAGSDVDVVLLTDATDRYVDRDDWLRDLGAARVIRTARWGVLTERRLALPDDTELDVGIASPAWASVDPVDVGTREVVAGGLRPLHDPEGILAALIAAVRTGPSGPRP